MIKIPIQLDRILIELNCALVLALIELNRAIIMFDLLHD